MAGRQGSFQPRPRPSPTRPGPRHPETAPSPWPGRSGLNDARTRRRRTRQAPAGPPGPGPAAPEECPEPLKRRGAGARPAPPQNEPAPGCRSALNSGRESSPLSHPYLSKRVPPPQAPGCLRSGGKTTTCHHHRHSKMADISALASPPLPPPWLPIIPS